MHPWKNQGYDNQKQGCNMILLPSDEVMGGLLLANSHSKTSA